MLINKKDFEINKELENSKWEDFDRVQEVKVTPELKWGEQPTLLSLDPEMFEQIRLISEKKGKIGTHALLRLWIAERLIDELSHLRKTGVIS